MIKMGDMVVYSATTLHYISQIIGDHYLGNLGAGKVIDIDDRGWLKVKWDLTTQDIQNNAKQLPDEMLEFRDPDIFEVVR
jgi:hypothetical protein